MESNKTDITEYDYLLILDFEAQCVEEGRLNCQEIIEFPVLIIDVKQQKVLDNYFHYYIRPTVYPILTDFCTDLTGIEQHQVEAGILIDDALKRLHEFLEVNNILESRFVFMSCGDWDLLTCLTNECRYKGIKYNDYLCKWINVKTVYQKYTRKNKVGGMKSMLKKLDITLEGRHHSGIDDSRNIAKIVIHMLKDGMKVTSQFARTNQVIKLKEKKLKRKNEKNEKKLKKNVKNEN
jgi:ERI1 exoribonuclease 3